jgi:hypothetical protein
VHRSRLHLMHSIVRSNDDAGLKGRQRVRQRERVADRGCKSTKEI